MIGSQVISVRTSAWYQLSLSVMGPQLTATVVGPSGQVTLSVSDLLPSTGGITVHRTGGGDLDDVVVDTADDTQPPSTPQQPQLLEGHADNRDDHLAGGHRQRGRHRLHHLPRFADVRAARVAPGEHQRPGHSDAGQHRRHPAFRGAGRGRGGERIPYRSVGHFPQPPTFPKSGDGVVPPTAPGAPVPIGSNAVGTTITWAPATDNIGVVEYHVVHTVRLDEV